MMVTLSVPNSNSLKGTVTVTLTGTPTPNTVEFYLDNVKKFTDNAAPFAWSFDTTLVANGAHTIKAISYHSGSQTTATLNVNVTNGVPQTGVAPVNSVLPAISGSAVQGGVLQSSTGTWNGSPTGYSYQWKRCDAAGANAVAITGATASSYTVTATDVGSTLRCGVKATNQYGTSTEAVSAQTAVVTAPATDTTPPAKPILSLGLITDTSLELKWQPGVDNVGVDHYDVHLGSGSGTSQQNLRIVSVGASVLSYTFTGLTPNTDYSLSLEVVDKAGNKSDLAQAIWWPVHTTSASQPPPTPPPGTFLFDQKSDFVPGIFNESYMTEISTPYGAGFNVSCPAAAVAPWDSTCKAVLGKYQVNSFLGKNDTWTMYIKWPAAGNPSGFTHSWLSCAFMEFHTESESGHHLGVDAGWFAGAGHNRFRFGRLVGSPGQYDYRYSSTDIQFDVWYKIVFNIKWSSSPGAGDGFITMKVGPATGTLETISSFSGITVPASGNNSVAFQMGWYGVTSPSVANQAQFGGVSRLSQ